MKRTRYQAPQRFFDGDEVSIISRDNVRHLTVTKAGPMKVTLSDETEWRQSGLKWGTNDSRYNPFRSELTKRERGLAAENQIKINKTMATIKRTFTELLETVSKTSPVYDIDTCLKACEGLTNYVRSLKQ